MEVTETREGGATPSAEAMLLASWEAALPPQADVASCSVVRPLITGRSSTKTATSVTLDAGEAGGREGGAPPPPAPTAGACCWLLGGPLLVRR